MNCATMTCKRTCKNPFNEITIKGLFFSRFFHNFAMYDVFFAHALAGKNLPAPVRAKGHVFPEALTKSALAGGGKICKTVKHHF